MTKLTYACHILGDSAIVIRLGADIDLSILNRVRQLTAYLENNRFEGFIEIVTAYTTITIYYDSFQVHNHYSEREPPEKMGVPAGRIRYYPMTLSYYIFNISWITLNIQMRFIVTSLGELLKSLFVMVGTMARILRMSRPIIMSARKRLCTFIPHRSIRYI